MKQYNFKTEIAVIGAGPAGLTAAIAAARRGHRVLLLEQNGYLVEIGRSVISDRGRPTRLFRLLW